MNKVKHTRQGISGNMSRWNGLNLDWCFVYYVPLCISVIYFGIISANALHYRQGKGNLPMQYTEVFFSALHIKNWIGKCHIFNIFAQNIDCVYT